MRLLQPQDTLGRISADTFAIILVSDSQSDYVIKLAEALRRSLSTPVTFGEREVALSASIGIALFDPKLHGKPEDLFKDAEIAMRHASTAAAIASRCSARRCARSVQTG